MEKYSQSLITISVYFIDFGVLRTQISQLSIIHPNGEKYLVHVVCNTELQRLEKISEDSKEGQCCFTAMKQHDLTTISLKCCFNFF